MKSKITTLIALAFLTLTSFAQQTMDVKLKITYRNNPLCYWDVTIKHGDMALARGKSDSNGEVTFRSVKLLSLSIDAYGIKTTPNGEKKWDVKGYITLNDKGEANFDFEKLLEETGMPKGMMETAWGLTLNDCSSGGSSSSSSNSGSSSSSGSTSSGTKTEEKSEWDLEQEQKAKEREEEQKQFHEDVMSGKAAAEGLENSRQMQTSKIASLNKKIDKKKVELAAATPGTKAHSELAYELRFLELDRDQAQVKLDKINMQIAKGNAPLNKYEREEINERSDQLKAEEDKLKEQQKSGLNFDGTNPQKASGNNTEGTETKVNQEKEKIKETEQVTNSESEKTEDGDDEKFVAPSDAELTNMSTVSLKKLKFDYNNKIARRKATLKTKASFLKQDRIKELEGEIETLNKLIEKIDTELVKRK